MKVWDEFLVLQEKELGKAAVQKWLRPLKILRFDACNLYLEAKDSFQVHWFEEHIRPLLLTRFLSKSNKRIKVHLSIAKEIRIEKKEVKPKGEIPIPQRPRFELLFDVVGQYPSLKNFIVSEPSQLTYRLLLEVVEGTTPLGTFNPIFMHGPIGCGKTHLLMALATALKEKGINVLYVRAETFTDHVVNAIRSSEMQKFRLAYRGIDALLIDDVEVFSKKGATQEELFHTFNALHLEGKQIVLTSKCPPSELSEIEPRLISRFEWGIVLPLAALCKEELRQLLLQHTTERQFPLSDKVIEFLLDTFKSSPKALLKAFEALVLRTSLGAAEGKPYLLPLSLEAVQHLLADLTKAEEESLLTPSKIIRTVGEYFGIRSQDILGKAQSRECTLPRQVAMYLCRKELRMPFTKMGDLFARDHSTVMTSVKQIEKNQDTQEVTSALHAIKKNLSL